MNNVNTQLHLLINALEQKSNHLKTILTHTTDQSKLLDNDPVDFDAFTQLADKKDVLISAVLTLDEGFNSIYENIRGILESQPQLYKEKILSMKRAIIEVGELGIAITVQETRNKNQLELKDKASKKDIKEMMQPPKKVANYYAAINKQKNINPQSLFDSKK